MYGCSLASQSALFMTPKWPPTCSAGSPCRRCSGTGGPGAGMVSVARAPCAASCVNRAGTPNALNDEAATIAPPTRIEREVHRLRELIERRQFEAALRAGETLLAEVPENRDVLYMVAVSLRYLNRISEALTALERLERLHPQYPRLFQ